MKKAGPFSTGKSGTSSHLGKSIGKTTTSSGKTSTSSIKTSATSGKTSTSSSKTITSSGKPTSNSGYVKPLTSISKTPSLSVPTKSYLTTSYNVPKKGKSTSFGILWIPTKKRNKHKELSYNSHQNDPTNNRAPSMYGLMSGDSSNNQSFLEKNKEDTSLLVPEYKEPGSTAIISAGAAVASEIAPSVLSVGTDEKQELIKHDDEDTKEAAGDTGDTMGAHKDDLESDEKVISNPPNCKDKDKLEDNVDSVFLRSPPPHKVRSQAASTVEEEDCGIKCLYYTLQCCDCVLM